jgi:hypothetical protein
MVTVDFTAVMKIPGFSGGVVVIISAMPFTAEVPTDIVGGARQIWGEITVDLMFTSATRTMQAAQKALSLLL